MLVAIVLLYVILAAAVFGSLKLARQLRSRRRTPHGADRAFYPAHTEEALLRIQEMTIDTIEELGRQRERLDSLLRESEGSVDEQPSDAAVTDHPVTA